MNRTRQLFAVKSTEALISDAEAGSKLKRAVGLVDLTALGIGGVIGTGIFVIISQGVALTGPAIVLAFLLAAITCAFSALAFAELASAIPVSGSAYTYAYATLGELVAWIIGWNLILEYGASAAAVAVGWGQYINELLRSALGISIPAMFSAAPEAGGVINLPAVAMVIGVTALLIIGVSKTARANTALVIINISLLLIFVVLAFTSFKSSNLTPFFSGGFEGVTAAASLVFFSYIGFEAISTSGEEARRPQRDLPIAILLALAVATVIYCLIALAACGAVPLGELGGADAPLAFVLQSIGMPWGASLISFGASVAITSVVLASIFGLTRIMFAMSRDGLVPPALSRVSATRGTPVFATITFGLMIALTAAVVPLAAITKLINMGTLVIFVIVNIGVLVLRVKRPDLKRGFRVPVIWVSSPLGIFLCGYLIFKLEARTWIAFGIWTAVGLAVYFAYGYRRSRIRTVGFPEGEIQAEATRELISSKSR